MDPKRRRQLIERYKDGVRAVAVAFDHLSEADLDLRPLPTAWSARQVIHHMADAELMEGVSLRRMLTENSPVLLHWDEARYAERLHYERPTQVSLAAFQALAVANIELLESLSEEQWRREGNQGRPWSLTVETWLEEKIDRLHNQIMQILNAPTGGRAIPDPH